MEEYPSHFFSNLLKIYSDIDSSNPDMTLHCIEDGTTLKCHRLVLSICSEYFKNVFEWGVSDVLEVHNGITGDTMDIVLKCIYSGKISLTSENVYDVLVAANFFGILQIVNQCIKFFRDNLQIDNCLEMLLFSWQLDLFELTTNIVIYVAQNFSKIVNDVNRLSSLPVPLMSLILGSNDLIIRNKLTNLPTRPAEREKGVLDFILLYTRNLDQYSDEDIEMLLSCVKWQFLDIFDNTKCILDHFATLLNNGPRESETRQRLFTKHTDGYLHPQPQFLGATAEDKETYGPRFFSCSELLWSDPMGWDHQLVTRDSKRFKFVAGVDEYINRIDLISCSWDGRDVIGGLKIHIKSPDGDSVCHHFGTSEDAGLSVQPIVLADGEHITAVNGKSGRLIDEIGFETSNSRRFGPFGGGRGTRGDLMDNIVRFREEGKTYDHHAQKFHHSVAPAPHSRIPLDTILVGVEGSLSQDGDRITQLRFCFRLMISCSTMLVTNEQKCEIDTMDAGELQGQTSSSEDESADDEDYDRISNYNELCMLYYDE